jgi:thiamine-monophosphate kinase
MAMGEFDLIDHYFRPLQRPAGRNAADIVTGIGDDAAVLAVPAGFQLVAALDTLVEGVHFPVGSPARSIGHRALAVNLSDLAAMGADPAWYLLSLTLPRIDEEFLGELASGMQALADRHDIALVGGDTTRGPLSVSVQALGLIRPGEALLRAGGGAGDLLFVSGSTGDAAAGLQLEMRGSAGSLTDADGNPAAHALRQRFLYPAPRVALGRALRGLASACIDVSDGLAADALKLATASGLGVRVEADRLPLTAALRATSGEEKGLFQALSGGDDYELCFSVTATRLPELAERLLTADCAATCIGVLESEPGLRVVRDGRMLNLPSAGFDHFTGSD